MPEDFAVVFGEAEGELAVGGVFLRIFIAQPTWVLKKPREFLIALLEKLTELLEKNNPHVSHQQNMSEGFVNVLMLSLTDHALSRLRPSVQQPCSHSSWLCHAQK